MYKLNAMKPDGSTSFEQVFGNYVSMKQKESELRAQGMTTIITPMTQEQHLEYSEKLMSKVIGLSNQTVLN